MVIDGFPRLTVEFFTNFPSRRAGQAGILSPWVGSLLVMIVTALFAIPVGVAGAIYLEEYAGKHCLPMSSRSTHQSGWCPVHRLRPAGSGLVRLRFRLRAEHTFGRPHLGTSYSAIVIVATREALRSIPQTVREGAYALGATKWQVCHDHLIPYGMPGILTGVIIGLSRAIGETAPIITIGALTFIAFLPPVPLQEGAGMFDWLFSPFTVMPIQIFNWTSRPDPAFHANAAAASLVLVVLTLSMNSLAIWLRYRLRKNTKW